MNNNKSQEEQFEELLKKIKYTPPQTLKKLVHSENLFTDLPQAMVQKLLREVQHLWTKCDRSIDLRYKEDGLDIERFDLFNIIHYLDIHSKELFTSEVKRYANIYTLGVYESVKAFFEKNKSDLALRQKLNQRDVNIVRFNDIEHRGEERMNLAISATLYLIPPTKIDAAFVPNNNMLNDGISVVTSNISHNGLKIKSNVVLPVGQQVILTFDDIEKELVFKQNLIFYTVLKCTYSSKTDTQDCRLKLETIDSNAEFGQYVKNLIFSHKYKYKVDIDTIYDSAQSKGYEQFYIDRTDALVLFINNAKLITHVLSDVSLKTMQAFEYADLNFLSALFAKDKVIEHLMDVQECYYFVARLRNKQTGKSVYLSAIFGKDVRTLSLIQRFSGSDTARLFKLHLESVETERALLHSAIPDDAQTMYGTQRIHRYSQKAEAIVANISQIITIVPLSTGILSTFAVASAAYTSNTLDILKPSLNMCSKFATILPETADGRSEDRFNYETPIIISNKTSSYSGTTETISSLGFSCRLTGGSQIPVGAIVNVSFEDFKERTTVYALGNCKYTVVGNSNGLLRASNQAFANHDGRAFWLKFIIDKLDQLRAQGREEEAYGLSHALRNLAAANAPVMNIFYSTYKTRLVLSTISIPKKMFETTELSEAEQGLKLNMKTWFYHPELRNEIQEMAKLAADRDTTQHALLILSLSNQNGLETLRKSSLLSVEKLDQNILQATIKMAQFKGRTARVIDVKLTKTRAIFNRFYLDELNYIKRFYDHRHKKLTNEISNTKGMLQLTDISTLILPTISD